MNRRKFLKAVAALTGLLHDASPFSTQSHPLWPLHVADGAPLELSLSSETTSHPSEDFQKVRNDVRQGQGLADCQADVDQCGHHADQCSVQNKT